jgi:hypothetical protein
MIVSRKQDIHVCHLFVIARASGGYLRWQTCTLSYVPQRTCTPRWQLLPTVVMAAAPSARV